MNERLEKYLAEKKVTDRASFERKRDKHLIKLGLYDKIYNPNSTYSEEYNQFDGDEAPAPELCYKIVPLKLTDEEYAELTKQTKSNPLSVNCIISKILLFIAFFVFASSFILGIYVVTMPFIPFIALPVIWCGGFVSGMLILGFAKAIDLLQEIKDKK